jgi:PAP2 superfamily protein
MNYARSLLVLCIVMTHNSCAFYTDYDDAVNYIETSANTMQKKKGGYKRRRAEASKNKFVKNKFGEYSNLHSRYRLTYMLGNFAYDAVNINLGLFSWDSLKIIITTTPFFVASRMIDEKLHNCFYDHCNKRNKNEPSRWVKEAARLSIGIPIAFLGMQSILSRDDDLRLTSQVFLTGMPFVLLAKDLIKKLDFDLCKRPFHEKFAKEQRAFGGFPSGHLAEAAYMAVLYGMRFGPNYAVPLGTVAVFVTAVFLSSNRHYLSQMIAGAGFGAMYAFSASHIIDSKLAKKRDLDLSLSVNENGGPAMNVSFRF